VPNATQYAHHVRTLRVATDVPIYMQVLLIVIAMRVTTKVATIVTHAMSHVYPAMVHTLVPNAKIREKYLVANVFAKLAILKPKRKTVRLVVMVFIAIPLPANV
jgi:hypothetical protein